MAMTGPVALVKGQRSVKAARAVWCGSPKPEGDRKHQRRYNVRKVRRTTG